MCDTLVKRNLPKEQVPEFVYKRVQKLPDGSYVSPVMGEPIRLGEWKTAPKRKKAKYSFVSLVKLLKRKGVAPHPISSQFEDLHNGKWAAFEKLRDAHDCSLVSNFGDGDTSDDGFFDRFPEVTIKCQIGGEVHKAEWSGYPTYLASSLKAIEEVCY